MLIPVRVTVNIYFKPYSQMERQWYAFYKDIELPISVLHTPHIVLLRTGDTFYDFKLYKGKLPLCVEGTERVVLHLDTVYDQDGALLKNLEENWSPVRHVSDAEDFTKTPEPPKVKKTRAKKVKVAD